MHYFYIYKISELLFPHLFTDVSTVLMLRETGSEVQRNFLQPKAYSLHFWCQRTFTVAKNITFELFVIKQQTSKQVMQK